MPCFNNSKIYHFSHFNISEITVHFIINDVFSSMKGGIYFKIFTCETGW